MASKESIFGRTTLLIGSEHAKRISEVRVILFGVGGVGSWCAESLIRSGIRHLTIVDPDTIHITNINRQLQATTRTVGQAKVNVLKSRLLEINPDAQITTIQGVYNSDTAESFNLSSYHYILDAIDSMDHKAHLIYTATRTEAIFFSSMGAALKINPSKIQVAEFWKVHGCPLAASLRRKFKKGMMPSKKFLCVYSDEVLENHGWNKLQVAVTQLIHQVPVISGEVEISSDFQKFKCDTDISTSLDMTFEKRHDHDAQQPLQTCAGVKTTCLDNSRKSRINGSIVHITAIFGFTLAGLVVQDVCKTK